MDTSRFISSFISNLIVIPAAALCVLPMWNQRRFKSKKTMALPIVFLLIFLPFVSFFDALLNLGYNGSTPAVIIFCFAAYYRFFKTDLSKAICVFTMSCVFMSFAANISNGYDSIINPSSNINQFSIRASIFQTIISFVLVAVLAYPLHKYGCKLIDNFHAKEVYYLDSVISGIFIVFNLSIIPRKYETLHVNKVYVAFWSVLVTLFVLYLLLCIAFYFMIATIMVAAEEKNRNQLLKMQENIYIKQKAYLEETARQRHDFKHMIRTLSMLASEDDFEGIKKFIEEYSSNMPENNIKNFTKNIASNAILNHYMEIARKDDIRLTWEIDIPTLTRIPDVALCCIIGNILENAILACRDVPQTDRFIDLSITNEYNKIYIAAVNSFNGIVKIQDGKYCSTRSNGNGIGLGSIVSTAIKYGGNAKFYHEQNEFYSEVYLRNESIKEIS